MAYSQHFAGTRPALCQHTASILLAHGQQFASTPPAVQYPKNRRNRSITQQNGWDTSALHGQLGIRKDLLNGGPSSMREDLFP
jgi:hypothetical protein